MAKKKTAISPNKSKVKKQAGDGAKSKEKGVMPTTVVDFGQSRQLVDSRKLPNSRSL